MFIAAGVMRVNFVYNTFNNPIEVLTTEYKTEIEDAAQRQRTQLTINSFNVLLCMFRFFKFYAFQDRLSILTTTFGKSWTDLYHFLIMFFVIFFGYSFIGFVLFGAHLFEYSSFDRAMSTQYEMMLNNYDFTALSRINGPMAAVYLSTYIFIVGILLINVLLAILIEAYTQASNLNEFPARAVHEQLALAGHRAAGALRMMRQAGKVPEYPGPDGELESGASTAELLDALRRARDAGKETIRLAELQSMAPRHAGVLAHKAYMLRASQDKEEEEQVLLELEAECGLLAK